VLAYHFTEMPYPFVPEEAEQRYGSLRITLPNRYFDPKVGHELYNRYLDEHEYADELGLEIMLNEHHQTATCLDAVCAISAAALIRRTRRATIVLLGNPLPHRDNPLRVAEEVAMLDVISGGRIVSGFVRGVGSEVHPANTNPAQNRERFEEAHDLIIKAWTTHEPFHWEGKHFQFRYANPWPRPYQQPHPPVWITGSSPENVPWVADHQYTFATFLTPWDATEKLFNIYRARCREKGFPEPASDRFAYLALTYTGETDARAQEDGKKLLWYIRSARPLGFFQPHGYQSAAALARMWGNTSKYTRSWAELQADGVVICGSPTTVIKRVREMHERLGVGHFLMMNQAGFMTAEETRRSMELFAREVYPAIRGLGEPAPAPAP
jgi:alkanesulfonate monooxygenase SsuD/methylene tetrahydromethanopterin reductase-like flavin-dependent oxidoreductase (luciferase family)